jgi:hypothetical protein
MSWIKENKFMVALGGGTLLGAIVLFYIGSQGASKYTQAKEDYDSAYSEVQSFVKGPLFPTAEHRDGKKKALSEYRESLESLQAAFKPFRSGKIENTSPQEFTNRLIAVDGELRKAFEASETALPDTIFWGFENYRTSLPRGNATGIMTYQLEGIKNVLLALAASGASELKNLHRPPLPEEAGNEFKPQPNAVARPLPVEITFRGPEKSVRAFLSSITKAEGQFNIIRSLRVMNEKKDPPKTSDAKFEKPVAAAPGADANNIFGGAFVLPSDEPAEGEDATETAPAAPAPAPAPSSNRILAQVLGSEEVLVVIRLDIMQFLPAKKLP